MNKKNNVRSQRTRTHLHEVLLKMLETENVDDITITSLCLKAKVNRSTFYSYYDSVRDLFTQTENDVIARFTKKMNAKVAGKRKDKHITSYLTAISDDAKFFTAYYKNPSNPYRSDVNDILKTAIHYYLDKNSFVSDSNIQYFMNYFESGIIAIITTWATEGFNRSPEEVATIIKTCVSANCLKLSSNAQD